MIFLFFFVFSKNIYIFAAFKIALHNLYDGKENN